MNWKTFFILLNQKEIEITSWMDMISHQDVFFNMPTVLSEILPISVLENAFYVLESHLEQVKEELDYEFEFNCTVTHYDVYSSGNVLEYNYTNHYYYLEGLIEKIKLILERLEIYVEKPDFA